MNKIQELLELTKLSRKELSVVLDISDRAIGHYIRNYRQPRIDICYRIIKLANSFGFQLTLEDLRPEL